MTEVRILYDMQHEELKWSLDIALKEINSSRLVKVDCKVAEDLVDLVEEESSCPIWNNLKRPDEKYVTERAYSHPMFVEDMVRNVALKLDELNSIDGYRIKISHQESIHQHEAIAKIKRNL